MEITKEQMASIKLADALMEAIIKRAARSYIEGLISENEYITVINITITENNKL